MVLHEVFTLSNGVTIPKLGLGTWMIADDQVAEIVQEAIKIGYRHKRTAMNAASVKVSESLAFHAPKFLSQLSWQLRSNLMRKLWTRSKHLCKSLSWITLT